MDEIRNKKLARLKADSLFPPLEKLAKQYMYVVNSDKLKLWDVPELPTKHKEANEDWDRFTGIMFKHEKIKLGISATTSARSSSESDELFVYTQITNWKNKKGKKMSREMMMSELGKMQQDGKVNWHCKLAEMKPNTFTKMYSTLVKNYGDVKEIPVKK